MNGFVELEELKILKQFVILNKLDLHGVQHKDVEQLVEDWVINQYNSNNIPCQIITGNSKQMQTIVIEVLERLEMHYQIGDFLGFNKGYIQVNK